MWYEALPHLTAPLNTVSAILLVCGYRAIRQQQRSLHAKLMVAAFVVSVFFLASYLTYHYKVGHTSYDGVGAIRIVYFAVLISHIVLAALVPFLAVLTLTFAVREKIDRHRRLAKWTLPIWLYVSVTGVIVYAMLYVF